MFIIDNFYPVFYFLQLCITSHFHHYSIVSDFTSYSATWKGPKRVGIIPWSKYRRFPEYGAYFPKTTADDYAFKRYIKEIFSIH